MIRKHSGKKKSKKMNAFSKVYKKESLKDSCHYYKKKYI